jgi:hypothetical protein
LKKVVTNLMLLTGVLLAGAAHGAPVNDPIGNFLSTLDPAAPRAGDLDAVSANVSLVGASLLFSATLNAPINTTPEAFYVLDRSSSSSAPHFPTRSIVTFSEPGTLSASMPESIRPSATSPFE